MSKINTYYWLQEAEQPVAQTTPDVNPDFGGNPMGQEQQPYPPTPEDDVTQDPEQVDSTEQPEAKDYEQWRHDFFDLAIKGDPAELISAISMVRERELEAPQRKFVEDNLSISLYRQDANIDKASREIRTLIKKDLDQINPGTTIMQHITAVLDKTIVLQENFVKLAGMYSRKGDIHRQFVCALLGAIQVGGGGEREDLIYPEKDFSINLSTRFYSDFGEINIGKWSLKTDDPQRYLHEVELKQLAEGAPEEKQVLRRRIIIESIARKYKDRAFLVHILTPDGTLCCLGWDVGNSLLAAYKEGKIVVRGRQTEVNDAQISDDGDIVPLLDYDILYVKETGEVDDNGRPQAEEVPFMERRNSILYVKADNKLLQIAADSMSGMFFKQLPWTGNPSDILVLSRCVPNIQEMLAKRCAGAGVAGV